MNLAAAQKLTLIPAVVADLLRQDDVAICRAERTGSVQLVGQINLPLTGQPGARPGAGESGTDAGKRELSKGAQGERGIM